MMETDILKKDLTSIGLVGSYDLLSAIQQHFFNHLKYSTKNNW